MESSRDKVARRAKERAVELAYRQYATLLVEHERVRRARWTVTRNSPWDPAPGAWRTLRFLASVHDPKWWGAGVLGEFFGRHGGAAEEDGGEEDEGRTNGDEGRRERRSSTRTRTSTSEESQRGSRTRRVPWGAWRKALRAGIDLVADVLVAHDAPLPWRRGAHRVPRRRAEFDIVCRFLRDRDVRDDDLASLAEILESVEIPPLPPAQPKSDHRVTFYRSRKVLSIDGVRMALPWGQELAFLALLWERRRLGEVTPRLDHDMDWKGAVDQLRYRIRKATGLNLLHAVVLTARGPTGGYRLAPGVRVRGD